jgi:predicted nucleotide-binding protein
MASDEIKGQVFVGHEYTKAAKDDLRPLIKQALRGSGLEPWYADDELWDGHIFKDKIIHQIDSSIFGIYDISNPEALNVSLELGAAIALGRDYVIICESGTKIPSNLDGLDSIRYESYRQLRTELRRKTKPRWPE